MDQTVLKILIIEDDFIIARSIETMLNEMGHVAVGIFGNGEDAAVFLRETTPDIVLMDINLNGKSSGIDLAREIGLNYNIPVIYITGYSDANTLNRAKQTYPYGYLLKPFNFESLKSTIEISYTKFILDRKIIDSEKRYESMTKYLNCLYGISQIVEESSGTIEEILGHIPDFIPKIMSEPEMTGVSISFGSKTYNSSNINLRDVAIICPILVEKNKIGDMTVYYEAGSSGANNPEKKRIFEAVAMRIGKTIEIIQAKEELKKLEREILIISEQERQSIGLELHDSLGQLLTGISFLVKNIRQKTEKNEHDIGRQLDELASLVKDATVQCRQLSKGLVPVVIENEGFLASLEQMAVNTREIFNIACTLNVNGNIPITDNFTATQLYLIIKEAVNNAVKHGNVGNIAINIKCENSHLIVHVTDDGTGIRETETTDQGIGMRIMKYRANLINAGFISENMVKRGFSISVFLPLSANTTQT
jgi:two-component system, LuxR family, sensor kinase FixL